MMFLIDKPFVSDFLRNTIRKNKFNVVATKVAKELLADDSLKWVEEDEAVSFLNENPLTTLYSNSENALDWVYQNYGESELSGQIKILKDKVQFRELIRNLFPDFYFKEIGLEEIHQLPDNELRFPFVIKPSVGFFSVGVHIVRDMNDWINAKKELQPEYLKSIYPENVLNTTTFIIEEFIQGEEYAIDHYYDENGNAVILNVSHHIFSSATDTSDRLYCVSKEIIESYKAELEGFLSKVGKELKLKNFPAHAEVRIDENGKIVPIEINPLRSGGWCTTGEILGVTIGYDIYKYFKEKKIPDWDAIFKGKEDKIYSIVILDNNSGIKPENIVKFDYSKLAKDFEHKIITRELDIHKDPIFGFVFTETDASNKKELTDILTSDLRKYIVSK